VNDHQGVPPAKRQSVSTLSLNSARPHSTTSYRG
jgi:hypothetical protein